MEKSSRRFCPAPAAVRPDQCSRAGFHSGSPSRSIKGGLQQMGQQIREKGQRIGGALCLFRDRTLNPERPAFGTGLLCSGEGQRRCCGLLASTSAVSAYQRAS